MGSGEIILTLLRWDCEQYQLSMPNKKDMHIPFDLIGHGAVHELVSLLSGGIPDKS